jgi:rhodanese-related sulfurtransferase
MDGEISPTEVETLLETADAPRVVDIRSPAAFRRGHIPGTVSPTPTESSPSVRTDRRACRPPAC